VLSASTEILRSYGSFMPMQMGGVSFAREARKRRVHTVVRRQRRQKAATVNDEDDVFEAVLACWCGTDVQSSCQRLGCKFQTVSVCFSLRSFITGSKRAMHYQSASQLISSQWNHSL